MFCDKIDFYGLEYWYNEILRQNKKIEKQKNNSS